MQRTEAEILDSLGSRCIGVRAELWPDILADLSANAALKKKFDYVVASFLQDLKNGEIFRKEAINDKCKDVWAIRIFTGGANARIYCQETRVDGKYCLIMSEYLPKKEKTRRIKRWKKCL